MCGEKAREVFTKLLSNWEMCVVDSIGQSEGLSSAWNPKTIILTSYLYIANIMMEGSVLVGDCLLKLINRYGTYKERRSF